MRRKRRRKRRLAHEIEEQKRQFQKLPRGLTMRQIMQHLGLSYSDAYRCCGMYGYSPKLQYGVNGTLRERRQKQLAKLPPNLTIKQIARRLKSTYGAVHQWIGNTDYVVRKGYKKVPHERWQEVDWTMPNADIARQMGVSRELVRAVRLKLHKPAPPPPRKSRGTK